MLFRSRAPRVTLSIVITSPSQDDHQSVTAACAAATVTPFAGDLVEQVNPFIFREAIFDIKPSQPRWLVAHRFVHAGSLGCGFDPPVPQHARPFLCFFVTLTIRPHTSASPSPVNADNSLTSPIPSPRHAARRVVFPQVREQPAPVRAHSRAAAPPSRHCRRPR